MFIKKPESELQTQRKLQKAGATLGFTKNQAVTVAMVREHFADVAKVMHPDAGNVMLPNWLIQTPKEHTLDDFRKAKDYLLKHMEDGDV